MATLVMLWVLLHWLLLQLRWHLLHWLLLQLTYNYCIG